jgi:hypothetical protein
MTRIRILGLAALAAVGIGLMSSQLVSFNVTNAQAAFQAIPIDVMQMMRDAGDLPVQAYDAI